LYTKYDDVHVLATQHDSNVIKMQVLLSFRTFFGRDITASN